MYCTAGPAEKGGSTGSSPQATVKRAVADLAPANHLDDLIPVNKQFDPQNFIRQHGSPPSNDRGGAMCLNYHVRGQCRQDCDRGPQQGAKSDHRRHSKSETARLVVYLSKGK